MRKRWSTLVGPCDGGIAMGCPSIVLFTESRCMPGRIKIISRKLILFCRESAVIVVVVRLAVHVLVPYPCEPRAPVCWMTKALPRISKTRLLCTAPPREICSLNFRKGHSPPHSYSAIHARCGYSSWRTACWPTPPLSSPPPPSPTS